jgi:hypothetical protein
LPARKPRVGFQPWTRNLAWYFSSSWFVDNVASSASLWRPHVGRIGKWCWSLGHVSVDTSAGLSAGGKLKLVVNCWAPAKVFRRCLCTFCMKTTNMFVVAWILHEVCERCFLICLILPVSEGFFLPQNSLHHVLTGDHDSILCKEPWLSPGKKC